MNEAEAHAESQKMYGSREALRHAEVAIFGKAVPLERSVEHLAILRRVAKAIDAAERRGQLGELRYLVRENKRGKLTEILHSRVKQLTEAGQ